LFVSIKDEVLRMAVREYLRGKPPRSTSEIAQALNRGASNMNRVLKDMQDAGLLESERRNGSSTMRSVIVYSIVEDPALTMTGRAPDDDEDDDDTPESRAPTMRRIDPTNPAAGTQKAQPTFKKLEDNYMKTDSIKTPQELGYSGPAPHGLHVDGDNNKFSFTPPEAFTGDSVQVDSSAPSDPPPQTQETAPAPRKKRRKSSSLSNDEYMRTIERWRRDSDTLAAIRALLDESPEESDTTED
jgi:hypothetical protein